MNYMSAITTEQSSPFRLRYDNFIGGRSVPPADGRYFDNITPISGEKVCEVARSTAADVEAALEEQKQKEHRCETMSNFRRWRQKTPLGVAVAAAYVV